MNLAIPESVPQPRPFCDVGHLAIGQPSRLRSIPQLAAGDVHLIVSTLNCSPGAWIAMTLSCSAHHFTAYASLFYSLFNYARNRSYMILQLATGRDTHSKQEPRRPDQSPRPTLGHLHRLRSANTKNHP